MIALCDSIDSLHHVSGEGCFFRMLSILGKRYEMHRRINMIEKASIAVKKDATRMKPANDDLYLE